MMKRNLIKPSFIHGFSLVELMVAMVISLFLTLGLFSMFRMSSTNVNTTSHFNELQENGRIALSLMERDISQAGFLGDVTSGKMRFRVFNDASNVIATDCVGAGEDNASYPTGASFRMVWGYESAVSPESFDCLNNVDDNTDVLQIKRVRGQDPNAALAFNNTNRHFVSTTGGEAFFFRGNAAGVPAEVANGYRHWEYAHHIYYIRTQNGIPNLRRRVLVNGNMDSSTGSEQQLVEGIENIRILYGIDTQGDSSAEAFVNAANVPENVWDHAPKLDCPNNTQKIVALRLFLLVRSIEADRSFTNDSSYVLGDKNLAVFNDNFRRKVVSTTIALDNFSRIDSDDSSECMNGA